MSIANINPERIFKYFEEICSIPRGSGNMEQIASYCVDFAVKNSLKYVRDNSNNVIIYKSATSGYEDAFPVILQGHLDMVCQKEDSVSIDFEKDPIEAYVDGEYIKARGTTLGADNGIGVAMVLALLERNDIDHPAIEAVFTTDEETGMYGAAALDYTCLKGRYMINIDSEEENILTVSCAGGINFEMSLPIERTSSRGTKLTLALGGLKGGHSGVDIDKGRINANILMAKLLSYISREVDFDIISLDGGDKNNAIPVSCKAQLVTKDFDAFLEAYEHYAGYFEDGLFETEDGIAFDCKKEEDGEYMAISPTVKNKIIYTVVHMPDGVIEMSSEIEDLVETSLNLGILSTSYDKMFFSSAMRSNKTSGLNMLKERLCDFAEACGGKGSFSGEYPPWEYTKDSRLQKIYSKVYTDITGKEIYTEAIHAGLECGLFAANIPVLDCISIGPDMEGIHTVNEKLNICSVKRVYDVIVKVLENLR